jgi:hypothetical protein
MAGRVDPILQAAIDRGTALPIGTPQTGHIVDDCNELMPGEATQNYLQPGQFGTDQITESDMEES